MNGLAAAVQQYLMAFKVFLIVSVLSSSPESGFGDFNMSQQLFRNRFNWTHLYEATPSRKVRKI